MRLICLYLLNNFQMSQHFDEECSVITPTQQSILQIPIPQEEPVHQISFAVDLEDGIEPEAQEKGVMKDQKKQLTTNALTTGYSKTYTKGRPKKQKITTSTNENQILSQHQIVMMGQVICYAYQNLRKQNSKCCRFGFLHPNIAPMNSFYLEIKQAIRQNNLSTLQNKKMLKKMIKLSAQLHQFLSKFLWLGSTAIVDELLYVVVLLFTKYSENIKQFQSIENPNMDDFNEIKAFGKNFADTQFGLLWTELKFINFKSPRLKMSDLNIQGLQINFQKFIEVTIVSTILSYLNYTDNPYFNTYFASDFQAQEKLEKIRKKQKKAQEKKKKSLKSQKPIFQKEVIQEKQINYLPQIKIRKNQLERLPPQVGSENVTVFNQNTLDSNLLFQFAYNPYYTYNPYSFS